jgi:hypothetical protein
MYVNPPGSIINGKTPGPKIVIHKTLNGKW